jgi:hypothetical protein
MIVEHPAQLSFPDPLLLLAELSKRLQYLGSSCYLTFDNLAPHLAQSSFYGMRGPVVIV